MNCWTTPDGDTTATLHPFLKPGSIAHTTFPLKGRVRRRFLKFWEKTLSDSLSANSASWDRIWRMTIGLTKNKIHRIKNLFDNYGKRDLLKRWTASSKLSKTSFVLRGKAIPLPSHLPQQSFFKFSHIESGIMILTVNNFWDSARLIARIWWDFRNLTGAWKFKYKSYFEIFSALGEPLSIFFPVLSSLIAWVDL